MWWIAAAWGQVEEFPCKAFPKLSEELAAGQVMSLQMEGANWVAGFEALLRQNKGFSGASSLLAPPRGSEPAKKGPNGAEIDLEEYVGLHDRWTCTYGAPNLIDGDVATAWVEGAPGPGVGEVVVIPMPAPTPLEIRAGYAKSPELYRANARPREIEVVVLGQGFLNFGAQINEISHVPVLGRHRVTLKDTDGWQPLPLPSWRPPEGWCGPCLPDRSGDPHKQQPTFLALRILSVYPGEKYEDACISEVRTAK